MFIALQLKGIYSLSHVLYKGVTSLLVGYLQPMIELCFPIMILLLSLGHNDSCNTLLTFLTVSLLPKHVPIFTSEHLPSSSVLQASTLAHSSIVFKLFMGWGSNRCEWPLSKVRNSLFPLGWSAMAEFSWAVQMQVIQWCLPC